MDGAITLKGNEEGKSPGEKIQEMEEKWKFDPNKILPQTYLPQDPFELQRKKLEKQRKKLEKSLSQDNGSV